MRYDAVRLELAEGAIPFKSLEVAEPTKARPERYFGISRNSRCTPSGPSKKQTLRPLPTVVSSIADQQLEPGGTAFTSNLTAVFDDADGDALAFSALSSNTAAATVGVSGATLTVTPQAAGTATITVTADDGRIGSAQTSFAVLSVDPLNPTAGPDVAETTEDMPVDIDVLANDFDPDTTAGHMLRVLSILQAPANGAATIIEQTSGQTVEPDLWLLFAPLKRARVAFGSVAPTPIRAPRAEAALEGRPLDEDTFAAVARAAQDEVSPISDLRASAWYRGTLVAALTQSVSAKLILFF